MSRLTTVLTRNRYRYTQPNRQVLEIDCKSEPPYSVVDSLAKLFPELVFEDPCYWFSFPPAPHAHAVPEIHITDVGRRHHTLEIAQHLSLPDGQLVATPYDITEWHAFMTALGKSSLCTVIQTVEDKTTQTISLSVQLSRAVPVDFGKCLCKIASMFAR